MPVPQYYKFHVPMLKFLGDGQPHNVKEVRKAMKEYFHLTDEEASQVLPSKRQTVLANRVGWASTYLKKAGLLDKPSRGTFVITEAGKAVLRDLPEVIDSKWLSRFESFRQFLNLDKEEAGEDSTKKK